MKLSIVLFFVFLTFQNYAQYAPAAGKAGSSALNKDSSIFVNWAKKCKVYRGWKNIAQKDSGFATIGDSTSAMGKAGENGIVSLGDSGFAICEFFNPIRNGVGWDFAVFENTFIDSFLELAFVEVSSDGRRFFRFPSHSLSDTLMQTGPFGYTRPEKINNLAGKYRVGFGTPFDLSDLPDYKDLDKNSVRFIKLLDVVGSLNPKYAAYDTSGRKINDPWPTPYASSGFDLDAIGVIHENPVSELVSFSKNTLVAWPNPLQNEEILRVRNTSTSALNFEFFNALGVKIMDLKNQPFQEVYEVSANFIPRGVFMIRCTDMQHTTFLFKGIKL